MYGTIRMYQEMRYPGRMIGTDLDNISFQKLAIAVGAAGYSVYTREEFSDALNSALKEQRPSVIEIVTEKEQISVNRTLTDIRKMKNEREVK